MARYEAFGGVNGIWSVVIALSVAIVLSLFLFKNYIKTPNKDVFDGAVGSLLPIFNTASEVGYGGVIKSLSVFGIIKATIVNIPGPPLVFYSYFNNGTGWDCWLVFWWYCYGS